jgi:predicted metal-binding protein
LLTAALRVFPAVFSCKTLSTTSGDRSAHISDCVTEASPKCEPT